MIEVSNRFQAIEWKMLSASSQRCPKAQALMLAPQVTMVISKVRC